VVVLIITDEIVGAELIGINHSETYCCILLIYNAAMTSILNPESMSVNFSVLHIIEDHINNLIHFIHISHIEKINVSTEA